MNDETVTTVATVALEAGPAKAPAPTSAEPAREKLTTGGLAHRAQVHPQTVRYYERRGLLPKVDRSASGRRTFSADTLRQLQFIKHAQRLGFSLREIKDELLPLWKESQSTCRDLRERVEKKIHEIDQQLVDLVAIRQTLTNLVTQCTGGDSLDDCPIVVADEESLKETMPNLSAHGRYDPKRKKL